MDQLMNKLRPKVLFPSFFIPVGILISWGGIYFHWPYGFSAYGKTTGVVEHIKVNRAGDLGPTRYPNNLVVVARYSYKVDGVEYHSSKLENGVMFPSPAEMRRIATAGQSTSKSIDVYYLISNPSSAQLRDPSAWGVNISMFIVGVGLALSGSLPWLYKKPTK